MARRVVHRLIAGAAAASALLAAPTLAGASIDADGQAPAGGASSSRDAFAGLGNATTTSSALAALDIAPETAPTAVAAATQPRVRLEQPCVVAGRDSLALTTSGWEPGSALTFWIGRTRIGAREATAAGDVKTRREQLHVPRLHTERDVVTRRLRVRDKAGHVAAPIRLRIVRRNVRVPERSRPGRRVTYRAAGFPAHRTLYLHVRRHDRTLTTVRLGRPHGACGKLRTRLRYVPLDDPRPGAYEYWFTNTRRFRAAKTLYGLLLRL